MNENKKRVIDQILMLFLPFQTVIMGIAFVIQICILFFREHEGDTFTAELVGKKMLEILPVILLWIVLTVFCAFWFKNRKFDKKVKSTNLAKMNRLLKVAPLDIAIETEEYRIIKREEKKRKIGWSIAFAVILICSILGISYLCQPKHFLSENDITKDVRTMTFYLLPLCIVSFVAAIVAAIYEEYSTKKSIDALQVMIKNNGKAVLKDKQHKHQERIVLISRSVILTIAVAFIIWGICIGGNDSVLHKAINICTECVGLG